MKIIAARYEQLRNMTFEDGEPVTLVAGENGCGKSSLLRLLADEHTRSGRKVVAVSGTTHHRFAGLKLGENLLAPGAGRSKPETVLKRTIARAIKTDEVKLRTLSRVLRHCGYWPEIGIQIVPPRLRQRVSSDDVSSEAQFEGHSTDDLLTLIVYLQTGVMTGEIEWLDFDRHHYGQSIQGNLANVVYWEAALKRLGVIEGVRLYLRKGGYEFPLANASSGELSLITSLAFISVAAKDTDFILIDEPENSLHPKWQREYMDLLQGAIGYSGIRLVIATHSPLLVMSANELRMEARTFVLSDAFRDHLELGAASLEEVLAEVFNTYSPRNHYLSKTLVELMNSVESGAISAEEANSSLREIKSAGVDKAQISALDAVSEIVASMELQP